MAYRLRTARDFTAAEFRNPPEPASQLNVGIKQPALTHMIKKLFWHFLTAISLALPSIAWTATTANGITVVSPEDGAVLRPGETVPVVISVDSSLSPSSVHFWPTMRSGLDHIDFEQAPYEGQLQIPDSMTGYAEIQVFLRTTDQQFVDGPTITIRVIPSEPPTSISVNRNVNLTYPEQAPIGGRGIQVRGIYENAVERWIGRSVYGTTFQSSNPSVVTVNENGGLTATGLGVAYITTENAGYKAITQVQVSSSGSLYPTRPPTMEQTSNVQITKSGFKRDQTTGQFVQMITVKNTSNLPLSRPLMLVVSGIPEGVELVNSSGDTKVIEPVFSQFVSIKVDEEDFLSPGASGTAILKFRNRDGVPIVHNLRVFSGRDL
jgi:hypothetical protein